MAMVAVEELRIAEAGAVGRMAVGEPEQEGNGLGVAAADNILLAAAGDIGHSLAVVAAAAAADRRAAADRSRRSRTCWIMFRGAII